MRQKIVGTYLIGDEYCELVLREGTGGEFYFMPEKNHVPRIKVGADYDDWSKVVTVLLHESIEFGLARLKCRFFSQDDHGEDMHGYLFIASHADYADACARAAELLTQALPDMGRAWKEWRRVKP